MNKSSTFSHLSYSTTTSTTWLGISSKSLSSAWLIVVEIQESVVSGCCKYTNVIQFLSVRERRFVVGACWSILLPQLVPVYYNVYDYYLLIIIWQDGNVSFLVLLEQSCCFSLSTLGRVCCALTCVAPFIRFLSLISVGSHCQIDIGLAKPLCKWLQWGNAASSKSSFACLLLFQSSLCFSVSLSSVTLFYMFQHGSLYSQSFFFSLGICILKVKYHSSWRRHITIRIRTKTSSLILNGAILPTTHAFSQHSLAQFAGSVPLKHAEIWRRRVFGEKILWYYFFNLFFLHLACRSSRHFLSLLWAPFVRQELYL